MSKRVKFSMEEKMFSVCQVLQGDTSTNAEAKRIGVTYETLADWIRKVETEGFERLRELKTWTNYSEETKLCAVKGVISKRKSLRAVSKKYHISSDSVLRQWISKYTSGNEIKSTRKGRASSNMTKGRKTTYKERIEIVQYTIAHDFDYDKAINTYHVSYQQVYSWVRKYQSLGEEGLKDGRRRKKEEPEEGTRRINRA